MRASPQTDATYERVNRSYAEHCVCDDCRAQFPPLGSEFDNELAGTDRMRMPPS